MPFLQPISTPSVSIFTTTQEHFVYVMTRRTRAAAEAEVVAESAQEVEEKKETESIVADSVPAEEKVTTDKEAAVNVEEAKLSMVERMAKMKELRKKMVSCSLHRWASNRGTILISNLLLLPGGIFYG